MIGKEGNRERLCQNETQRVKRLDRRCAAFEEKSSCLVRAGLGKKPNQELIFELTKKRSPKRGAPFAN